MKLSRLLLTGVLCLAVAASFGSAASADDGSASVDLTANVVAPPAVYTCNAAVISKDKAILVGKLVSRGASPYVSVSFGWDTEPHPGDASAYANWTPAEVRTRSGYFWAVVPGLSPRTTYYFRAKGEGVATVYGAEASFYTPAKIPWWYLLKGIIEWLRELCP